MNQKNKYISAIVFFIFMQILVIIKNISVRDYSLFFWFCDFAPILFVIALMLRDDQLVKGIINIGLILQIFFSLSILAGVLFNINLFGFLGYIHSYTDFYIAVSLAIHLLSANIALLITYKTKTRIKSLLYSAAILIIMFILTLTFTNSYENINYVYKIGFFGLAIPYSTPLWVLLSFLVIVVPTYFIQKMLYWFATRNQ